MGTVFVDNLEPQSGTTLTLGASGDTVGLATGASQTLALNTPAFHATLSSTQTITNNTFTKLQIDNEIYVTDGCYDNSSNYRFTPTSSGKYFVYGCSQTGGSNNVL